MTFPLQHVFFFGVQRYDFCRRLDTSNLVEDLFNMRPCFFLELIRLEGDLEGESAPLMSAKMSENIFEETLLSEI